METARDRGLRVFPLAQRELELRDGGELRGGARPLLRGGRQRLLAAARLAAHSREAAALIDALDPEFVVAWGMRSALALLLARAVSRAPVVFAHNDFLPGPLIGALVRAAARSAARVIVPSSAVAADLDPRGRLSGKVALVRPGVDVEAFAQVNGAPAQPPEVLVLGALVGWKRPELALEALALARSARPDLRLRLVGAPLGRAGEALSERLRARASRPDLAGAVDLAGPAPDLRPQLERASCLLHCSPREPFGLVLVESLAAGRPVVAPAGGGPSEIVDRSCGILYPPGDASAAAHAIVGLLGDPERAAAMGASGRAIVRSRFDLQRSRREFAQAVLPVARLQKRPPVRPAGTLALVTVTHNSAAQLERLLESAARHLPGVRLVVVDCGSSDRTVQVAHKRHDQIAVELLAFGSNPGFGAGCNRGLQIVREPVTALLNPDVELLDESLLALAQEALRRDAPERLLAPLVISPNGSRQDTIHPRPASPANLAYSLIPPALVAGPLAPLLAPLAPWRSRRPRRVGWAVGCALVARTSTLTRLGPFDERIFLYGEDLDLGLHALSAGIETWFWPHARVLHTRAHATGPAFGGEPFELLARARHEVVARRLGPGRARLDDAAQAVTFASRLAIKRALGRAAERERRQLAAIAAVRRSS